MKLKKKFVVKKQTNQQGMKIINGCQTSTKYVQVTVLVRMSSTTGIRILSVLLPSRGACFATDFPEHPLSIAQSSFFLSFWVKVSPSPVPGTSVKLPASAKPSGFSQNTKIVVTSKYA